MSSNNQQLSTQKHLNRYPSRENAYQVYKKQRQFTTQGRETQNQKNQFTCGHNLSYTSDDEITFKQKQSGEIISMSHFQQQVNQGQSIATFVIDQNIRLKQQLKISRQEIHFLKKQLKNLELAILEHQKNDETELYKKIILELKSEILLTLTQNKQITEEISQLKQKLSNFRQKPLNEPQNIKISNKSLRNALRCRSNSLQINKKVKCSLSDQKQEQQLRKTKELLESIKCMYEKITGYRIQSLKQLWRWLKDLGHFYSHLRKWKSKAECCLEHLCYSTITNEDLAVLIEQAIKLVE